LEGELKRVKGLKKAYKGKHLIFWGICAKKRQTKRRIPKEAFGGVFNRAQKKEGAKRRGF